MSAKDAPAPGLLRSAQALLADLVALAHTRAQLVATELREEAARLLLTLVYSFIGLFFAGMAIAFAGVGVLIAAWDSYRLTAAVLIALVFLGLAIFGALGARKLLRAKPRPLDASLSELEKDYAELRSRP